MLKAYKYRIYPNKDQCRLIEHSIACCRLVYNLALETKVMAFKEMGVKLSCFDLCYQLTEMKKEYHWLQDVDSQALQASIKKVDVAFLNFYKGCGYPKFKKNKGRQSFQSPNNKREIDFNKGLLTIPKIKNIPIVVSRKFSGDIKTVTISRVSSGKYFASILVDNKKENPPKSIINIKSTLGIDLGIKEFAVFSNGEKIVNPHYLKNYIERIKCLSRRAAKKNKGSINRKKANRKVSIIHERILNMRNDFLQKLSTRLVRDSQMNTFCIENLSINGMIKNHSLAQSIGDVSWGEFVRQLQYKADWYGKNIIQIGKFEPSTKTCCCCGISNNTLTLKDREWTCDNCGTMHDRDINAAINIKNIGLKNSGWGTSGEPVELLPLGRAKKQEV